MPSSDLLYIRASFEYPIRSAVHPNTVEGSTVYDLGTAPFGTTRGYFAAITASVVRLSHLRYVARIDAVPAFRHYSTDVGTEALNHLSYGPWLTTPGIGESRSVGYSIGSHYSARVVWLGLASQGTPGPKSDPPLSAAEAAAIPPESDGRGHDDVRVWLRSEVAIDRTYRADRAMAQALGSIESAIAWTEDSIAVYEHDLSALGLRPQDVSTRGEVGGFSFSIDGSAR